MQLGLNIGPCFQIYASADRVKEYIDVPVTESGTARPVGEVKGELEFKSVEFSYPKTEDIKVLKNVKLDVNEKKKVVALVGQSGCGKSSIISLIEHFYQPLRGEI